MSERNDLPARPQNPAAPAVSPPNVIEAASHVAELVSPAPAASEEEARARIAALEREARALGNSAAAALLFHEMGLLWEDPLRNPRNAAVAYQNAYKLAPRFLANIRAARRLFADVGNWQMVAQLLDAEIAAHEDRRARAPLLFQKARVLEERLSREEEALRTYAQCLEAGPDDVNLLVQLEGVYAERSEFAALAQVYRLLAGAVEDPTIKAHYLTAAGLLLEDRLKDRPSAAETFRAAFAVDRREPLLLAAIQRAAERDQRPEELLQALAAEAESGGPGAATVYLQIAKLHERLGRPDEALAALVAARQVSPTEALVLSELAQIYEARGEHEQLADVLLSWVASVADESEVVAINLRLAALYEENLKRDADAIERYRAILARIPGHATALAGLGKLYHRMQDWEGLIAVFDAEVAAADDPRQKAGRVYKAAEILEERLRREEDAIARYQQALQLQPGFLPAQKALTRLYERQGRYAELVAMCEQDLLQTTDSDQIIATLHKMALIHEERLSDLERAIDCMKRVLELAPDHLASIRNLARLYERSALWRELTQIQETEASLAGDTKQVLSLHHRNAEILEEHLQDIPAAIAAYERVLALSPSYLPALKSLGRLYARDNRWEDLIRMYRAEAEIAASTEVAAQLTFKVGELYEQKLGNENDAIASYQEVLTLAPYHFAAMRSLARLYRAQGAWESLVEILRSEAANRTDPAERANALYQAAAIWEQQIHRLDLAVEGYQEVLRLSPGHGTAIRALERIYSGQDNPRDLIAVLDRQTQIGQPASRVSAFLKLAHIYLDRFSEPNRAAQCCDSALSVDPDNVAALTLLERIRGADRARRNELRLRLAESVAEPKLRNALRLAVAADEDRPSDSSRMENLRAAWASAPEDPNLGFLLERALRSSQDFPGLAELYEHQLERLTDPGEQVVTLLRLGELLETRLKEVAKAAQAYEKVLAIDPEALPAASGARRCWVALRDWARARDACVREGRTAKDARSAHDAFLAGGRISLEILDDRSGAETCFRHALQRDPLSGPAAAGLEQLLTDRGGAADLAALHLHRGEAKLAQKDGAAAAAEFFAAARLHLDKLNDRARALAIVERTLEALPSHAGALELKGDLALEAGQYAEAAAAYSVRVQQGGEPRALCNIHLKLGAIYHDNLSEVTRAAAHLQTALAADPGNPDALERLAQIHSVSRNWSGAVDVLRQLIERETRPAHKAKHLLALAQVTEEGLGNPAEGTRLCREALQLAPADPIVLECLAGLYERANNLGELVGLLEQQALRETDRDRRIALRLRIAELAAGPLGDQPKAVLALRGALEVDPHCTAARVALAGLLEREQGSIPHAIEEHRALLRTEPTRLDSVRALFRLWQGQRQLDRAFCAAGVLQFFAVATEAEAAFYAEARSRIPQESSQRLAPQELDLLHHPSARNAVVDVLRAIGDQLTKFYPPQLDSFGVDRKTDRLKPDHAVAKLLRGVIQPLGVEEYEVYQSKRGLVTLETTEPLSILVGQEVTRRFNAREQRFLLGRAALGLLDRAAVLRRLSSGEATDLLGNAIRIHQPGCGIGRRNDETTKQLRKAFNRKALKALEGPAAAVITARVDVEPTLEGVALSEDRAGLLLCADVAAGLGVALEDQAGGVRQAGTAEAIASEVTGRPELRELVAFALSEDFFRLRQKLGLALA